MTISGSVKQTAGIATGSNTRRWPAMISATITPCAMARCASIGSPVRSPTAQTLRIEVRAALVDPHEGAVHREIEPIEAEPVVRAPPPDGDEDLVGRDVRAPLRRPG